MIVCSRTFNLPFSGQKCAGRYRFGFNGMEKDNEVKGTGNSLDFGARIYDSRLGRWLSVDPLAAKHAYLTPYNFVNNSPLAFIDPDGKDWIISVTKNAGGGTHVKMTLDVAVMNSSGMPVNMNDLETAIKTQVETYMSFSTLVVNENKGDNMAEISTFTVETSVNIRSITDVSQINSNEHLIDVRTNAELGSNYGEVSSIGGRVVRLNYDKLANIMYGNDNNTVIHELGHTLGLLHVDSEATKVHDWLSFDIPQYMTPREQAKNPNNAMFSGRSTYMNDETSTEFTPQQIKAAAEGYSEGDINQGSNTDFDD